MKRTVALASAAAVAALAVTGIAPADATTSTYFSSCAKLHQVYPHGVAKSYAAAQYQVRTHHYRPAYGTRAQKVYWANYKRLDRDRDGTACEVTI